MNWIYALFGLNTISELTMLIGYNLMYKKLGANDGQWVTTYIANVLPYVGMSQTAIQAVRFIMYFVENVNDGIATPKLAAGWLSTAAILYTNQIGYYYFLPQALFKVQNELEEAVAI